MDTNKKLEFSEEDMIEFAEFVAKYSDKNKNYKGEMLYAQSKYDGAERTIDLLQLWKEQQPIKIYYNERRNYKFSKLNGI